jgi:hypothetical protein
MVFFLGRDLESVERRTRVEADGDGGGEKAGGNCGESIEKRKGGVRAEHCVVDETGWRVEVTKEILREKEGELVEKVGELESAKGALEEEVVVRKAHQGSEAQLDKDATGLKRAVNVNESVDDLEGLFQKNSVSASDAFMVCIIQVILLERKTGVFSSNSRAVLTYGKTISTETNVLTTKLEEFIQSSILHTRKLRNESD